MSNIDYIVSGINYVEVCINNNRWKLLEGLGPYFGISWNENKLFILDRNKKKGEIIRVFNTKLELIDNIYINKVLDGHQILWYENKLFITDTAHNGLVIYDGKINYVNWTNYTTDVNHINSLAPFGKNKLLVCYNNGKHPTDYSQLVELNIVNCKAKILKRIGVMLHNFCNYYCCNSGKKSVIKLDKSFNIVHERKLELWTRGLDIKDGILLVGGSIIAKRADRHLFDGTVWVLDDKLNILDTVVFPKIGQINDIRIFNTNKPHNGINFQLEAR